ncbi:hypothetical protein BYT27DRAFT_7156093 [Phlegmacium glaucopus]|nr:hypothetical protein BYT27DRAFT_7156093 [Phlegmacium glaucopus]
MTSLDSPANIQSNREILTLGVLISVMVYGGVAALALTYIPLLLKTSHTISRRMRNFLLAYVAFMVTTSTVNTVTLIIAFTIGRTILQISSPYGGNGIENLSAFPNGFAGAVCVTFASWGADGFMLWRCAVLYEGISRRSRLATLTVLILLAMASFGFCMYLLINPNGALLDVIVIITTIINTIAAILIAARIIYFQRKIRVVASERNSQYTTIVIICIESSVLIIFFSILYAALVSKQIPASFIFMQSLVHVNVISPLLIVYRVALGKAVTKRSGDGPAVSALHFASTRNNGLSSAPEYGQI